MREQEQEQEASRLNIKDKISLGLCLFPEYIVA